MCAIMLPHYCHKSLRCDSYRDYYHHYRPCCYYHYFNGHFYPYIEIDVYSPRDPVSPHDVMTTKYAIRLIVERLALKVYNIFVRVSRLDVSRLCQRGVPILRGI